MIFEALKLLLGPALIAAAVSILINLRSEKVKARRDYITGLYDMIVADIEYAVQAASDYFPLSYKERTQAKEAKLLLSDQRLRHSYSVIMNSIPAEFHSQKEQISLLFDDVISTLTGSSFQSKNAKPDTPQLRIIASKCYKLREKLLLLRQRELQLALDRDPTHAVINWLRIQHGIARHELD